MNNNQVEQFIPYDGEIIAVMPLEDAKKLIPRLVENGADNIIKDLEEGREAYTICYGFRIIK